MKTDRQIIEAKYRAAQLVNMVHLKIAFWACRMRKIQRITSIINAHKAELESK